MGNFLVMYTSRVVIYYCRVVIRFPTGRLDCYVCSKMIPSKEIKINSAKHISQRAVVMDVLR